MIFVCFEIHRESERNKAIKLLLKIYKNLSNNPNEIEKYGDLNFYKIDQKLSSCKPAMDLLFLSGFTKSQNNNRLIWTNTNNNIMMVNHIQNALQSSSSNYNNNNNKASSAAPQQTHQVL